MTKFAFFEGEIRPITEAKVGVMTHTLNYGTGCFGGLRGYSERDPAPTLRISHPRSLHALPQ